MDPGGAALVSAAVGVRGIVPKLPRCRWILDEKP